MVRPESITHGAEDAEDVVRFEDGSKKGGLSSAMDDTLVDLVYSQTTVVQLDRSSEGPDVTRQAPGAVRTLSRPLRLHPFELAMEDTKMHATKRLRVDNSSVDDEGHC